MAGANEGAFRGRQVISDVSVCVCVSAAYSSETQSNTRPSSGQYHVFIIREI